MKQKLRITLFIILLSMVWNQTTYCQDIIFNKLLLQGMQSLGRVFCFAQDENGTIWIATNTGLYSYDGNQVASFRSDPLNPNSFSGNVLSSVISDNNGIIWTGGLGNGLDRLDSRTGIFTHFQHDPNNPASLCNDTIITILKDKKGMLWIGTHGGLEKLNPETNTFIHYRFDKNDTTSLSNNQVRAIYEDKQGTLWIGTGSPYPNNGGGSEDGGLNRMDKETGKFTRYLHNPNNKQSLANNKVSAIFEDNQGTFWIGTAKNGIFKMNRQNGTFERINYDPEHPENYLKPSFVNGNLPYDYITFINQDNVGTYWFGTTRTGLFSYDPVKGKTTRYNRTENSISGFTDNSARAGFTSRDGIFWIGTQDGNLYHFDPDQKKIQHTSVSGEAVFSFFEEPNGDFWIGTDKGLIRSDKDNGNTKRFVIDGANNYRIATDQEKNIWISTKDGLYLLDKKNEKFTSYKNNPSDSSSLSNNNIISIYEDSKSNLWIGTQYGLNLMDRKTGHFARFYTHPENISSSGPNNITSILEDKSGKLWISNVNGGGVNLFNRESKNFKNYLINTGIAILFQDSENVLWAGGMNGLYKYNRDIDDFLPYVDPISRLGIPRVMSIVEDQKKNLWLFADKKIVRINPERDETSFFGENYGVGQQWSTFRSGYVKSNGEIYFGDYAGYFSFFPDELIKNQRKPEIVFTGFNLSDKKIIPGDGDPLTESLSEQREIRLGYDQNVFSIDLAIIDYANPEQNRLNYFLEDYDISWRNANSDRRAYYFNVPPGKYTFRAKGVNAYGIWAEKTINIIIKPPWYRTWLAYGIYTMLLIAVIFGFDRIMRKRIVEKELRKAQERELAQAKEIEKAYTELKNTQSQLIQSEKMASLGELTAGIAHEIQNPLNFVNNFSEVNREMIAEMKEEIDKGNYNEVKIIADDIEANEQKIIHHGKRADAIVKGMLQHSRTSTGQKELTDINALADEYLRLAYHGMRAKDKSFNADFRLDADESLPKINVVPQEIGRVLLNLINNAFYAVNEKVKQTVNDYKPSVVICTKLLKSKVEIQVQDNGNGIPDSVKEKIFQPFFTTKPTGQGTGLGLSLSYDIIKVHGGTLEVESKENTGTTFIIKLP